MCIAFKRGNRHHQRLIGPDFLEFLEKQTQTRMQTKASAVNRTFRIVSAPWRLARAMRRHGVRSVIDFIKLTLRRRGFVYSLQLAIEGHTREISEIKGIVPAANAIGGGLRDYEATGVVIRERFEDHRHYTFREMMSEVDEVSIFVARLQTALLIK